MMGDVQVWRVEEDVRTGCAFEGWSLAYRPHPLTADAFF